MRTWVMMTTIVGVALIAFSLAVLGVIDASIVAVLVVLATVLANNASKQMKEPVYARTPSAPLLSKKLVVRCADCGCSPEECREAPSAEDCPNCKLDECCCWSAVHGANGSR